MQPISNFGCYKLFKGMRFYNGKIIHEGNQKLRNDGDVGNIIQGARKATIMTQAVLDKDAYLLMKY